MINEAGSWADHHFPILFEDEHLVAVHKPSGLMIHPTGISEDKVFMLSLLRDQLGQYIFPIHRLDRGTSGVIIFGKSSEAASLLGKQIMEKTVGKNYLAVVRGWPPESGTIDYPLVPELGKEALPAVTHFRKISQSEIEHPIGLRYPTARFSLVEATLETGRRHQIRKHLDHLRHPVINCRFGDVKQNHYFRDVFGIRRLLLHSACLEFEHPFSGQRLKIEVAPDGDFVKALEITGLRL